MVSEQIIKKIKSGKIQTLIFEQPKTIMEDGHEKNINIHYIKLVVLYKDKKTNEWKESKFLPVDCVYDAINCLDEAYKYLKLKEE